LLRREIPDGDPSTIVDRALTLLLKEVERAKLGKTAKPRAALVIRPGTDNDVQQPARSSRHVPSEEAELVFGLQGVPGVREAATAGGDVWLSDPGRRRYAVPTTN